MVRIIIVAIVAVILDVFALIDLRYFDSARIRTMNKPAWTLIIIFVPIVGAVLWFLVGRGRGGRRPASGPVAPDDDPEFLRRIRVEKESEERIRRLEQELADLERDADESGPSGRGARDRDPSADDRPVDPSGDGQSGR